MRLEITLADEECLSRFQRDLLERFRPLLDRVDPAKVGDDSLVRIERRGEARTIRIAITASEEFIPGLELVAAPGQCVLSVAESEVIECHRDPGEATGLLDEVYSAAERYLRGTTVVDSYNTEGAQVRRDYYYGIDTEKDTVSRIGISRWPLLFPKDVQRTEKHTYRFLKSEAGTA